MLGTIGWSRDSRDSLLVPTRGRYQRVLVEVGLPPLDLAYYRLTYQIQRSTSRCSDLVTLGMNGELGYGDGYGDKPYPFFKNFYRRRHRQRARLRDRDRSARATSMATRSAARAASTARSRR